MATLEELQPYWDRGWEVIPVKPGKKAPERAGWTQFDHTKHSDEELEEMFEGRNVGLLLGPNSGNIVDVDLDVPMARGFARYLLNSDTLKIGRPGNPESHFLYVSKELASQSKRRFIDPYERSQGKSVMMLELRTAGSHQLIPPSQHPSDSTEQYQWEDKGLVTPIEIKAEDLLYRVHVIAAMTLLARHWHKFPGAHHDMWMAICGGVLRSKPSFWTENQLGNLSSIFMEVSGYEHPDDPDVLLNAASSTRYKYDHDLRFTGWRNLKEEFLRGEWSVIADAMYEWLPAEEEVEEEPEPDEEQITGLAQRLYTSTQLLAVEVPPAEWLIEDYVMKGEITSLLGDKGVGKSLLTLAWCGQMAENGERVLYYDEENGIPTMQTRYKDLGIVHDNLYYIDFPALVMKNSEVFVNFLGLLKELEITVVVFDSVVDIANTSRLSINDNDEMGWLYRNVFARLRQEGLSVILQDHKPASGDKKGKGVTEKGDLVQVEWDVSSPTGKSFSRTQDGELILELVKDRQGYCGARGDKRKIRVLSEGRRGVKFVAQTRAESDHDNELRRSVKEMGANTPSRRPSIPD